MNRKILILVIILSLLFIELYSRLLSQVITGLANYISLSIGIASTINGTITYFSYPYIVNQYYPLNITVEFTNIGSIEFQEKIEIYILDQYFSNVSSYYSGYKSLIPGERTSFKATHTPTESGYFWIYVRIPYDGEVEEAWGTFYSIPYRLPTTAPAEEAVAPSAPPGPERGLIDMWLEYPEKVTLTQGQSTLIYVTVQNIGNVTLHNLMLLATIKDIPFDINPKSVSILTPDSTLIFLFSINVPIETSVGTYPIDFYVRSDEISKEGQISLTVMEMEIVEEVDQTIMNYLFLIKKIRTEIEKLSLEGKNVTLCSQLLEKAEQEIQAARDFYELKKYQEAKDRLEKVKKVLEQTVICLAYATIPPMLVVIPGYVSFLAIIIVLIIIPLILFLLYKRRREEEEKE